MSYHNTANSDLYKGAIGRLQGLRATLENKSDIELLDKQIEHLKSQLIWYE